MKLFFFHLSLVSIVTAWPTRSSLTEVVQRPTGSTRLVQYVQTFHDANNSPLSLLPLLNENTHVTHVILASFHINDGPGNIALNDKPPSDPMFDQTWNEVKTLQQNGIKVMGLLGGAAQGSYERLSGSDADFDSYYTPLLNVIKQYSLDGLDLDIEEPVDLQVPLRLLQRLHSDLGGDFLLTMAPVASALASSDNDGLSQFSYFDLDSQALVPGTSTKLVSWYNTQFYSGFGDASSPGTYQSIIGAGWDPSRIVMGVLDSSNDGSGFVDLSSLQSTIQQLRAQYSTFGGVDGWEYFNAGSSDGLGQPWQWDQAIGNSLFGAASNIAILAARDVKPVSIEDLPLPPTPFSHESIVSIQADTGAGWFGAVRALNLTSGDPVKAKALLLRN